MSSGVIGGSGRFQWEVVLGGLSVLLVAPKVSWAHPHPPLPPASSAHGFSLPDPLLFLAILIVVGLCAVPRDWRKAAVLVLALALAVFAVEATVHPVLHMPDRDKGTHWLLHVVSLQLAGAIDDTTGVPDLILAAWPLWPGSPPETFAASPSRPDQGRAPPTLA